MSAKCEHCGVEMARTIGKHAERCAAATPEERAHYARHRKWPGEPTDAGRVRLLEAALYRIATQTHDGRAHRAALEALGRCGAAGPTPDTECICFKLHAGEHIWGAP